MAGRKFRSDAFGHGPDGDGPRSRLDQTWQTLGVEQRGRTVIVRFDRGHRANPLSLLALHELTEVAQALAECPHVSAVVLTGRTDGFCMGMDLKDPALAAARVAGLAERRLSLRAGPRMCAAWEAVDAITICAIEGWCVGGGVALAVACDLRVTARGAWLYVPEVERGMNMSWGSVPRISALVGPARAKRLVALCERIDAETALSWGLADRVCDDGGSLGAALAIAKHAATLPPTAMKMVKHDVNAAAHALAGIGAHRDLEAFALLERSDDFAEGVQSFLEDRPATFTGD
ncbi:MAG: enoyl-CoA hydratase/isomerase family protein [Burkholderiaceae bacterium]